MKRMPYSIVRFTHCPLCRKSVADFYTAPVDLYPWEKSLAEKVLQEKLEAHFLMEHDRSDHPNSMFFPWRFTA